MNRFSVQVLGTTLLLVGASCSNGTTASRAVTTTSPTQARAATTPSTATAPRSVPPTTESHSMETEGSVVGPSAEESGSVEAHLNQNPLAGGTQYDSFASALPDVVAAATKAGWRIPLVDPTIATGSGTVFYFNGAALAAVGKNITIVQDEEAWSDSLEDRDIQSARSSSSMIAATRIKQPPLDCALFQAKQLTEIQCAVENTIVDLMTLPSSLGGPAQDALLGTMQSVLKTVQIINPGGKPALTSAG